MLAKAIRTIPKLAEIGQETNKKTKKGILIAASVILALSIILSAVFTVVYLSMDVISDEGYSGSDGSYTHG